MSARASACGAALEADPGVDHRGRDGAACADRDADDVAGDAPRGGLGWRQEERVAESAQAISDPGRELHGRLVKLSNLLSTLGSRLNSTVRAYNEAVGSYEARVLPAARRFEDHGSVAGGRELPELEPSSAQRAQRPRCHRAWAPRGMRPGPAPAGDAARPRARAARDAPAARGGLTPDAPQRPPPLRVPPLDALGDNRRIARVICQAPPART